jgi:hypothetical protein
MDKRNSYLEQESRERTPYSALTEKDLILRWLSGCWKVWVVGCRKYLCLGGIHWSHCGSTDSGSELGGRRGHPVTSIAKEDVVKQTSCESLDVRN